MARELTVGEVAERSGVAISTLHFYEQKGLIASERTRGNQRRYKGDVLRRIAVIKVAQEVGISLMAIGEALAKLPMNRTPTRQDWALLARDWKDDLENRIRTLESLRDGLDGCIGCGCLSLTKCRLRNRDDRLAIEGAGPRLLVHRAGSR